MSLNKSPLRIELIDFPEIKITASNAEGEFGSGRLTTHRAVATHKQDSLKRLVTLRVTMTAEDPAMLPQYEIDVTARGFFHIEESYPTERAALLVEVNGTSILYGAIRELVSNFTARSSQGGLILESMSFAPKESSQAEPKIAAKKTSTKRGRTK